MPRQKNTLDLAKRKLRVKITEDQINYVRENFHSLSVRELADRLNLSENSVIKIARQLKLRKLGNLRFFPLNLALAEDFVAKPGVYGIFSDFSSRYYLCTSTTLVKNIVDLNKMSHLHSLLQFDFALSPQSFSFTHIFSTNIEKEGDALEEYRRGLKYEVLYNGLTVTIGI